MKKLLILQNSDETPPGTTLEWCAQRGLSPHIIEVWQSQDWPDLKNYLGVVICGGGMNVDEENKYPWLKIEKEFIQALLQSGVKTLGLCLGAQLMAEVLGARVYRHAHWEVGWHSVQLPPTPFYDAQEDFKVFQWHRYTFEIPKTAETGGASVGCAHQAFVYQKHGLAFQFHPESSKEWIKDCAESDPGDYPSGPFVENREAILNQLDRQSDLQRWYWSVLDRFFLS